MPTHPSRYDGVNDYAIVAQTRGLCAVIERHSNLILFSMPIREFLESWEAPDFRAWLTTRYGSLIVGALVAGATAQAARGALD